MVQEVRREEGAEPWPRRRDFVELEEVVVVMDLRSGSADLRGVVFALSDEGRMVDVDTVEIWSFRIKSVGVFLDFGS